MTSKPVVTERMLTAALRALPEHLVRRPQLLSDEQLRAVLEAALREQPVSRTAPVYQLPVKS